MSIGLTFLLSVIFLGLIMVGSCFYFMFWMNKSTFNYVNDLDEVRTTGQPAERWQKRYLKKCRKLGRIPPELFERQKKRNLRHLRKLERFCRTTKLMESEEVRQGVLQELSLLRQEWRAEELQDEK